ncbi:MAG: polyhydroxyalkanoate depolymerase [Gammaproteobacteria bacterium]|nr:polyhydroxyalkanoate depolymerase [Gammaproteobacteria bacterium]MCP5458644.1 polyhydroxyalkanoate depolymerase [Gammaproteobacteria bacterium]
MLYHVYEMQHSVLTPVRVVADHTQHALRNPWNPFSYLPGAQFLAATCDQFEHLTRRYAKPKFGLRSTWIDGEEVAVEEEVVDRKTFGQLKHFKRHCQRDDPKLMIVAPMSGHYATLLRGTVEAMLPDHEVYITDWRDARDVGVFEGSFDFHDFVDYLIRFLETLGPNTHVLSVCQPCVPALAANALMAANAHDCLPASLILMGGPVDVRHNPTQVNQLAQSRPLSWFEKNVVVSVPPPNRGFMRRVYPGFLQLAGFMSMNLDRHFNAHRTIFRHLVMGDGESAAAKREFYEEYLAVMDLCAEFYLQTIQLVFQDFALPKGEMVWWDGEKVVPAAISRTALMTIEGELDDICGLGQTHAAHDLCTGLPDDLRAHYVQPGVGHYGIFNGRRWRDQISPRVKAFIRQHDREGKGRNEQGKITAA